MGGYNLPPGCSVNDIPGNSARDVWIDLWLEDNWYNRDELDNFFQDCPVNWDKVSDAAIKEVVDNAPGWDTYMDTRADEEHDEAGRSVHG